MILFPTPLARIVIMLSEVKENLKLPLLYTTVLSKFNVEFKILIHHVVDELLLVTEEQYLRKCKIFLQCVHTRMCNTLNIFTVFI